MNQLTNGAGPYYDSFRNDFNAKITAVNGLPENIRAQWSSPLSMAYHWWKHEGDFDKPGAPPVPIERYFGDHAENIFNTNNLTVRSFTQSGNIKNTYMRSFGRRIHIGYTAGPDEIRASHFTKEDTR